MLNLLVEKTPTRVKQCANIMRAMKNLLQIFLYGFVITLIISCGTLGHIQFYNFNASKDVVEEDLLAVINKDSLYSPPSKWNNYEIGADSTRDIFIMFQSNPKELYQ